MRDDEVLTPRQVMRRLNVGKSLVYQLAADGTIPSIRIRSAGSRRGALRFFASDVEAYLARLRAESRGQALAPDPDEIRRRVLRGGTAVTSSPTETREPLLPVRAGRGSVRAALTGGEHA